MTLTANTDNAQSRRNFLTYFSSVGLSSTLLPGVLWGCMQETEDQEVTLAMTRAAAQVAGLDFNEEELEMIVDGVNQSFERFAEIEDAAQQWAGDRVRQVRHETHRALD